MPCAPARRFPGLRAAVSHGGGRSSLLRLTSSASRLPTAVALGDWVDRVMRAQGDAPGRNVA